MSQVIYKAADGRIFEDYNKGVIHQKVLEQKGKTAGCQISCDGGAHWDWEFGAHGWQRKASPKTSSESYKDFIIFRQKSGFSILNLNGEELRRCKTKAECKNRIDSQTV